MINKPTKTGRAVIRRNALAVALAVGLGLSGGAAFGQSTSGRIFGTAPSAAGQTVKVVGQSGTTRTVTVGADGTYAVRSLPVGTYTVTLMKDGAEVSTRNNVGIQVGGGTEVDFAGGSDNAQELAAMQVNASALPSIDVTSVTSTFTVDAAQLERLPVGRSAEAIALLAPGVVAGSGYFGNVVTFGGAGATENAYYVNGYNTTALYNYTGSAYQLPYGAISQQENLVGGYSAKYGRADGGVINQIGKRGTNEWHFGGQFVWTPRSLKSDPRNTYYPNIDLQGDETFESTDIQPGDIYQYRGDNKSYRTRTSVYAGGPLIQDKLFFFFDVEATKTKGKQIYSVNSQQADFYSYHDTKYYAKIDWNINENNILEFTQLKQNSKGDSAGAYGQSYDYDYDTGSVTGDPSDLTYNRYDNDTKIFHYTGYLSDAATLSVLYGYTNVKNPSLTPNPSDLPFISGSTNQDPSLNGGHPISNSQNVATIGDPSSTVTSKALRVDFDYQLGNHLLEAGIDNLTYGADGQGRRRSGPGYVWIYNRGEPGDDIRPTLNVGAPGGNGYYVYRDIFSTVTSMSAEQKAWYLQDKWQITPDILLHLGIRNDHFTNANSTGANFVDEPDQWEPRVGFSWDVFGDSSLKVYGNAGRYYLAIPQATGERAASGSTFTDEYYTYTGIDSNGIPTGLTPVGGADGGAPPGPVSTNNEFGVPPDADTVTSTNLKPQFQDEFILGFDKTWGPNWVYGAKATYRTLGTVIDDECDPGTVRDAIDAMGIDSSNYAWASPGCRIFNPNRTNIFKVNSATGGDPIYVPVTQEQFNFPDVQRDYYALDFYLNHPFDGTWAGRIDYTFARSWGNAEGQVRSDLGQTDVSVTEDWDYWQLMDKARGYLANHRRHQLKAYGAWQMTPEWLISGTLLVQSGMPESCLGFFGPDQTDPGGGYGSDNHWCRGEPSPPGKTTNPWTKRLDLGVAYRPNFADNKLAFRLDVFNVTDEQETLQTNPHLYPRYSHTINNTYHMPLFYQTPRYVRLSVSYDY